jgi:hypothetical protein
MVVKKLVNGQHVQLLKDKTVVNKPKRTSTLQGIARREESQTPPMLQNKESSWVSHWRVDVEVEVVAVVEASTGRGRVFGDAGVLDVYCVTVGGRDFAAKYNI